MKNYRILFTCSSDLRLWSTYLEAQDRCHAKLKFFEQDGIKSECKIISCRVVTSNIGRFI